VRAGLRLLALLACATAASALPAGAQQPSLTVLLQNGVPRVQATALLADGKFVGLMRSGFPLRLHFRLELWRARSGWFDQFVSDWSGDAVAHHDPLADDFLLIRTGGAVARYTTADSLERALEIPLYVRWLKGDVSPAVSGEGNVGGALVRGAQRILVRIAGLPRLTLEARSETFTRD